MNWFRNLGIGYRLAAAFLLVIGLGLAGYAQTIRTMRISERHNRRTEEIVDSSISLAKDAALASHDTGAETLAYVYTGDQSDWEKKWETDDAAAAAFTQLKASLDKLPSNHSLLTLYDQTWRLDKGECERIETQALKLAKQGRRPEAAKLLASRYVEARYRLEIDLAALTDQLDAYRRLAETAELQSSHYAVVHRLGRAGRGAGDLPADCRAHVSRHHSQPESDSPGADCLASGQRRRRSRHTRQVGISGEHEP